MDGNFTSQIRQGVETTWHRGARRAGKKDNKGKKEAYYFKHANPLAGGFTLEIDWRCGKARAGWREEGPVRKLNVWRGMRAFFRTRHIYIFGIDGFCTDAATMSE